MARKIILDVDTGIDDALALMLALRSPELEVVSVTCVAGNTTIENATRNTLAVLDLLGSDIPVAIGARKPLMAPLRTASFFHGDNGLANLQLPPPTRRPTADDAASFLVRQVRERPAEITVVAVGPLTNLALAILRDAAFPRLVAGLYLMGGAVGCPGNATAAAEANFSNDPEAAAAVLASGAPLQIVDLGATTQAVLPRERIGAVSEEGDPEGAPAVGRFAAQLLRFYDRAARFTGIAGPVLHDPLAVALTAIPELAAFVPVQVNVEAGGTHARGASLGNFGGFESELRQVGDHLDVGSLRRIEPNATVPRQIDVPRFLALFLERLEMV